MADVKMTRVEMFNAIKAIPQVAENQEMVDFIDKQIVQLAKRKSAESKTQKENKALMEVVVDAMELLNKPATATQIMKSDACLSELSLPKVSALLKKLIEDGRVERTIEKKIALFSLVENEAEEE